MKTEHTNIQETGSSGRLSSTSDTKKVHGRIIPLVKWNEYHSWPPIGGLRHLVFHSKSNGFAKVIKRCGRRILIDETKFFEFVDQKNEEKVEGVADVRI